MYRKARLDARNQLQREDPLVLKSPRSVRALDLLAFKYGLQHYYAPDKQSSGIPTWLTRFPLRSVA